MSGRFKLVMKPSKQFIASFSVPAVTMALLATSTVHAVPFELGANGSINLFPVGARTPSTFTATDSTLVSGSDHAAVDVTQSAVGLDGTTVTGSFSASATPATADATAGLHTAVNNFASTPPSLGDSPGANAQANAFLKDTLFFTTDGGGVGLYILKMTLDATLSMSGGPMVPNNAAFVTGSILLNGNFITELTFHAELGGQNEDPTLSPPSVSTTVSFVSVPYLFAGPSGSPFDFEARLSSLVTAFNSKGLPDVTGQVDASHSLHFTIDPVSPGSDYSTLSGASYRTLTLNTNVPETANTALLIAIGSIALASLRRRWSD